MTIPEAAAYLKITRGAVYDAIKQGKLIPVEVLGKQALRRADVVDYQPRSYRERVGAKPVGRRKAVASGDDL